MELGCARGCVPPPSPPLSTGCHHQHFYLEQDKRLCPARQTSTAGQDSCNVRVLLSLFFYSWQRCSLLVHLRMQHGLCDAALDNLLLSTTGSKLSDCLQQTCSYQPCCKSNIPAPVGHPSCLSLSLCPPPQHNKVTWEQPRASQLNMVTNNRLYSQQHKAL